MKSVPYFVIRFAVCFGVCFATFATRSAQALTLEPHTQQEVRTSTDSTENACATIKPGLTSESEKFIQDYREKTRLEPYQGQKTIESLLKIGVQGDVFAYAGGSVLDSGAIISSGYYIKLNQFPSIEDVRATRDLFLDENEFNRMARAPLISDPRVRELLQSLSASVSIFLTNETGYRGRVPMVNDQFRQAFSRCVLGNQTSKPFLVLALSADYYTIVHEMTHFNDLQAGTFDSISRELSQLQTSGLPELDAAILSTFIFEQRAYHSMYRQVIADRDAGIQFPTFARDFFSQDRRTLQAVSISLVSYTDRMRVVLGRIKHNKPISNRVVGLIQLLTLFDGPAGTKALLPELFPKVKVKK